MVRNPQPRPQCREDGSIEAGGGVPAPGLDGDGVRMAMNMQEDHVARTPDHRGPVPLTDLLARENEGDRVDWTRMMIIMMVMELGLVAPGIPGGGERVRV